MGVIKLDNGFNDSPLNDEEDYEKGNEGERDYKSNAKGGRDGENLDRKMKAKYPETPMRGREYR
jgi:hypothetical protein